MRDDLGRVRRPAVRTKGRRERERIIMSSSSSPLLRTVEAVTGEASTMEAGGEAAVSELDRFVHGLSVAPAGTVPFGAAEFTSHEFAFTAPPFARWLRGRRLFISDASRADIALGHRASISLEAHPPPDGKDLNEDMQPLSPPHLSTPQSHHKRKYRTDARVRRMPLWQRHLPPRTRGGCW